MKFKLSTLLLLTALIVLALGWWLDRTAIRAQAIEFENRIETVAEGGLWWAMAEHARQLSTELRDSPDSITTYNRRNLVTKIFWLFVFEEKVNEWCQTGNRTGSASKLTGDLLEELGCKTHADFIPLFTERFANQFQEHTQENHNDFRTLKLFIEKSLN